MMSDRAKTQKYPLNPWKKFKISRTGYNSCLGEALKRHKAVKSDKQYRTLLREPKSKERDKQLADIRLAHIEKCARYYVSTVS